MSDRTDTVTPLQSISTTTQAELIALMDELAAVLGAQGLLASEPPPPSRRQLRRLAVVDLAVWRRMAL